ncbi:MAG TPA: hypothetical protein PKB10_13445, partial [Tepidisphaeraceae bacterium]|nr:hypothetical protein [Tepidisphaeraceae bacterium]
MTLPAGISTPLPSRVGPAAPGVVRSAVDAPGRNRWMLVAIAPLAILYLLLFNPMWVPGGDSDFYLVVARNLVTGNGYTFNGEPVGMSPPGWPMVLAGLMWISPTFGFIKLTMIGFMLTSLGLAYRVLLRFCSPRVSAMVILLAGTLHPLYPLTFWTHSESLFCLIAWATLLLAFRINEGRSGWGAVAGVVLLSIAAVLVRWTGLIQVVLVAGILLSNGRWRDRTFVRGWVTIVL